MGRSSSLVGGGGRGFGKVLEFRSGRMDTVVRVYRDLHCGDIHLTVSLDGAWVSTSRAFSVGRPMPGPFSAVLAGELRTFFRQLNPFIEDAFVLALTEALAFLESPKES